MQLSTFSRIDGKPSMVVNYYPIEGTNDLIYKVLKFQGVDTMSTKCISKKDFEYELRERIGMGWEVTDFHTEPVNVNYMAGAC